MTADKKTTTHVSKKANKKALLTNEVLEEKNKKQDIINKKSENLKPAKS